MNTKIFRSARVFYIIIVLLFTAGFLYAQKPYPKPKDRIEIKEYGKKKIVTKYKRQWLKERSFMVFLNLSRIFSLHQPLIGVGRLQKAAFFHSYDMAKTGKFAHYAFDKRSEEFNFRGENIIWGRKTALGNFIGWFTSDGHRRNMFEYQYFYTGIGFCKKITYQKSNNNKTGKYITIKKTVKRYGTQVFK